MKKFILSCIAAILCICAAAAVAYYVGNLPIETYWPNKQVRLSIPRKFFVPNGTAKVYHENGKLAYQYNVINNTKNGEIRFYLPNKTVTMHYLNDTLMGLVDIENEISKKDSDTIKPKIVFEPENKLTVSYEWSANKILITGKRKCSDDDYINRLVSYSFKPDIKTFENLISCFSFEHFSFKDQVKECVSKGIYVYPNYKSDFQSVCTFTNESDLNKDVKNLKMESLYDAKNDTLKLKIFDTKKPNNSLSFSYKGLKNMTRTAIDIFLAEGNKQGQAKFLGAILNDFTASDTHLIMNNKKVWNIKGDFNLTEGFSNPYYISAYTDNQISSQIKISPNGLNLKALYPVSRTPMFSIGLNINNSFKTKYKNLIQEINKTIAENVNIQNPDYSQLLSNLSEYMWDFSDLFNSLSFTLSDIQGQPVLNALVQLKKGISTEKIEESPASAFALKLTTYQDGEAVHQAVGNLENGFIIDGEPADGQEILALLNNTTLNAVLEDINNELELKYAPIVEKAQTPEDYIGVDPFFLGFYTAYKESMIKFKLMQTIAQISTLAMSMQALYQEDGNYDSLRASDLMQSGVITQEMLNSKNQLLNAFNGKIRIMKSLSEEDADEHEAFILVYEGLPSEACFELATFEWGDAIDGFIAIKASPSGMADVTKAYKGKSFEKRASGTVYHPYEAQRACGKSNKSSIALKFE